MIQLTPAFLARASYAVVLADAGPAALVALAPFAVVLADARSAAWLAFASLVLVLADALHNHLFFLDTRKAEKVFRRAGNV